jgi:HEAT repeat protein
MTVAELLDAFDGPALDGEEYRASFYDDVAYRIAELGGLEQLRIKLDTDDNDRLAAVLGAFGAPQAASADREARQVLFRRYLTHGYPSVVVAAIDGLRITADHDAKDHVLELIRTGPSIVTAAGFAYMRLLFADEATPILVAALDDPNSTVRFAAVNELDDLEGFSDRATFERMLHDPDPDVGEHARYILDHHFKSS